MKKMILTTGVVFTLLPWMLPLWAGEDDWSLNNSYIVWAEAAFFRRAEGHQHRLIVDQSQGTQDSCGNCNFDACDTKTLVKQMHYEPGFRVGMAQLSKHTKLEMSYLWVREWKGSCQRTSPGSLYFSESHPDMTTDFSGANHASAHYASWFQNGEVNYFKYITLRRGEVFSLAWLGGLRYIYLGETLKVGFTKGTDDSSYHIHAWNNIPTLQVGGTFGWNPHAQISWDLGTKVGLGLDWNRQHTRLGDLSSTVTLRDYQKSGFSTPLVVEASLSLSYQIQRFLNVHAAYQMIYLNGIVVAPDQIVKKASSARYLRANGEALIHGWTAGLTWGF